jgi:NTE family protein
MNLEQSMRGGGTSQGRVVTLTFVSRSLSASSFTEPLAQSLRTDTGSSVVLVRLLDGNNSPDFIGQPPLTQLPVDLTVNENFRTILQSPQTNVGFHLVNLRIGDESRPPGWIAALLEQLRNRFDYVLIEAMAEELPAVPFFEFLLQSDTNYLFIRPSNEDVYQLDLLVHELRRQLRNDEVEVKPVLCLAEGELVDGYDALIRRVAGPVDTFIRGCPKSLDDHERPSPSFHICVRRLGREISNTLVGLALSSGAAKGLSHIGVIQVLEENGIEVDVVAGSSMGAYVGAAWAFGLDGQKLEQLAREMESRWALWSLIDPVFLPRQGFLRGYGVKKRLMRTIGHVRFAELQRPFRVVATNLETLERYVFSTGEVADAVHASIAVPGICVPVKVGSETYVDGGIVNPLPVDVLREMGVSRIIAVNCIPTPDRIRYCLQAERELEQLSSKHARQMLEKLIPTGTRLNYFTRGNILEILMRCIHGAQVHMAETLALGADIVLRPQISDDRWVDFRDPSQFIQPGRQIAERYLNEIKALVTKKVVKHETTVESMVAVA